LALPDSCADTPLIEIVDELWERRALIGVGNVHSGPMIRPRPANYPGRCWLSKNIEGAEISNTSRGPPLATIDLDETRSAAPPPFLPERTAAFGINAIARIRPDVGGKQTRLCARYSTPLLSHSLKLLYIVRGLNADRICEFRQEINGAQRDGEVRRPSVVWPSRRLRYGAPFAD
jgi:hypothetical protein